MKYDTLPAITRGALTFSVSLHVDEHTGAPWEEQDGHGPVREIRRNDTGRADKRPGERLLAFDGYHGFAYDWQGAMAIAERDQWGLAPDALAALAATLGRDPTRGEVAAAAVQRDFDYLLGYCSDAWHYCGVVVTLQDVDGGDIDAQSASLWGIESNAGAYLSEVAGELADEVAASVGRRKVITQGARSYRVRR